MREEYLSRYSTFNVGGKTSVIIAKSVDELVDCSDLVLGFGSNILVSDSGLPRVVTINRFNGIVRKNNFLYANSGELLSRLTVLAYEHELTGLEWAYQLPGSVGGAIKGNVGAFGGEISKTVLYVDVFRDNKLIRLSKEECGFGYRTSAFSQSDIIVGAGFILSVGEKKEIKSRMSIVAKKRATQPKGKSAGSIFKKVGDVSAGYYIEKCGLKGVKKGGAIISPIHANFIINNNDATANDIFLLIKEAESRVFDEFGISLEREVKLIGEF